MITPITVLDAASLLVTLFTLVMLAAASRVTVSRDVKIMLTALLALSLLHNLGNLLEWAGISHALENYEGYVVALIPVLFIFLFYAHLRRVSERERRLSSQRYEVLFNSVNDAIFMHGYDGKGRPGRFIEVNDIACQLLGYSREELLRRSPREVTTPQYSESQPLATRRLRERRHLIFEQVLIGKDESRIPVEISSRLFDYGGRSLVLSIARDLRVRKDMEEQLRRSQRLESIGRLAGGIAHDFNNLLTVISGYCELLLNQVGPEGPLGSEVREIRSAADRASFLTRQLLAFSRKQIFRLRMVDLGELVRRAEQMLRRLIGEDVELAIESDRELWKVRADPDQIQQVILNLAVNSRDAMPRGGRIAVRIVNFTAGAEYVERRPGLVVGKYVLMEFSDTGEGMSPDILSHIFEPFFTTKELGKGTGLGLSTVYGIIKQTGGYIYASSEPKKGTTFELLLPQVEKRGIGVEPSEPPIAVKEASGESAVLVVEDEPGVRSFIIDVLKRNGYKTLEASSGDRALEICSDSSANIGLIVSDLVMPGISGVDLCERARERIPGLRCLLISGYPQDRLGEHGVYEKGLPFLSKPFSAGRLLEQVEQLLAGN